MPGRILRGAWILVLLCAGCGGGSVAPRPPNIVLIYIDDLGWGDAGFMGSTYYETPRIDALAAEGMIFRNAYSNAPNCMPSRASLMSGQYTPRHGIYTVGSPARGEARLRRLTPVPNATVLDTSIVTLAEALRVAGYATAQIGKWHLGDGAYGPTGQGFDVNVAGDGHGNTPTHFFPYANDSDALPDLRDDGQPGEYLTDRLTDEALAFIDAHTADPFFLYLSHYAVHVPLEAPGDLVEHFRQKTDDARHNNPTYAAMIASVDVSVGRLLDRLDSLRLAERTVVIFTSDNGGVDWATSMAPLRGAKGMLYEGGLRVPMVVRWSGHVTAGTATDVPVIGTDLYPTLLDLAGTPPPPGQPLDGVSLMPLLTGEATLAPRGIFWHFPAYLEAHRGMDVPWRTTPAGAVREGDYKLIEFFEDGTLELYNLRDDPGEHASLVDSMPARAESLHAKLIAWREALKAPLPY